MVATIQRDHDGLGQGVEVVGNGQNLGLKDCEEGGSNRIFYINQVSPEKQNQWDLSI